MAGRAHEEERPVGRGREGHRLAGGLDDGRSETLLMPQVHWEVTNRFMIQAGLGTLIKSGTSDATAALRVIYTF